MPGLSTMNSLREQLNPIPQDLFTEGKIHEIEQILLPRGYAKTRTEKITYTGFNGEKIVLTETTIHFNNVNYILIEQITKKIGCIYSFVDHQPCSLHNFVTGAYRVSFDECGYARIDSCQGVHVLSFKPSDDEKVKININDHREFDKMMRLIEAKGFDCPFALPE